MSCALCGSDAFRDRHEIARHRICDCTACGLVQLHPMPPRERLDALYGDAYFASDDPGVGYDDYTGREAESLATFSDDARRIRAFAPGDRLLEVGCGFGYFLTAAARAGFDVCGIDASPRAVAEASRRAPGRVARGSLDAAELAGRRFDVIFAAHVVEHVSEPRAFVAKLASHLAPGGVLVLVTPNVKSLLARVSGRRWVSFKVPEHVAFYAPDTLRRLLVEAGLEVLAIDRASEFHHLPFLMQRIRALVRPLDRLIPPFERWAPFRERMLRVTSGSMRVIARRGV